jgi:beta-glucosidase
MAHLLALGLLATAVTGQDFGGGSRDEDAFSYVQPENTTILGPYGHSPAVLPSRMYPHLPTLFLDVV